MTPIPVLSPAIAAAVAAADGSADGSGGLGHLAAPPPGCEAAWAAARGLHLGTNPPLAVLSESDAGIETAVRLELALGATFGNARSRPPPLPPSLEARSSAAKAGASVPPGAGADDDGGAATTAAAAAPFEMGNVALRWKHATVAAVARAGLRAPRQVLAFTWAEARAFLGSGGLNLPDLTTPPAHSPGARPPPLRAVLKPTRGAASMDVFAVADLAAAEVAFAAVLRADSHGDGGVGGVVDAEVPDDDGASNRGADYDGGRGSGSSSRRGGDAAAVGDAVAGNVDDASVSKSVRNAAVLVQEFLSGDEFAVDTVRGGGVSVT